MNAFAIGSNAELVVAGDGGRDDGAALRDRPPKPCSARVGFGWCVLEDGHTGECRTPNPNVKPSVGESKPPERSGSWSTGNRRRL